MHKDELIQMHTLLCQIKNFFETKEPSTTGTTCQAAFGRYDDLGISPLHVHRSKQEHKRAIFVLSQELADLISNSDISEPARVSHRLGDLLSRMERPTGKAN